VVVAGRWWWRVVTDGLVTLTRQQLMGHKCRAYADGAASALDTVVETLQLAVGVREVEAMTGPEAIERIAADLTRLRPVLLADLRRLMAEKAGIEL
jgi:hypothetical protein